MDFPPSQPFASFWQAGYEGADHINRLGRPIDMNLTTGHLQRARADYAMLAQFGIRSVRESIGWRLVEHDGQFDFSPLLSRLQAARELGLQICWTFCHYGWPQDVDIYGPSFVARFARFCRAAARFLAPWVGEQPVYSPINELSFTAWGLSIHMFKCRNMHHPQAATLGKRQLVRATLAGCDAIWEVTPGARIYQCDPMIHVIAPEHRPDWEHQAAGWSASQFEAWDMLCGRAAPELGGHPRYLDLVGGNYYHSNQWESGTNLRLWWHLADPRRRPLHQILLDLYQRYQRPVLLAETSHVGSGRGSWIREMASEAMLARQLGADLRGVCLYPVIDRPDWENPSHWHRSGLWDVRGDGARALCTPYAMALHQSIRLTSKEPAMQTLIVFSHLRWNFVFQRPQHLMTHLARHYKVLFVEEPICQQGPAHMVFSQPAPNVTVCTPHTPVPAAGFHDDQIPLLLPLVSALAAEGEEVLVWCYTPMALPLIQPLQPALLVYDCMDELSAFQNAPRQLLQREKALLKIADLVFTGGPSLYEAKRAHHANTHCFPSSVDVVHFEQALDRGNSHPLHSAISQPRLGFYGVIDERFDPGLIAALADAHPDWQIVLIGPIIKIAPDSLPQRQNVHYLGQQPYQALPHFLAGWDVCLLPFALNDATRYISPTKVLEYMAAGLPIVSTDIRDVRQPYGELVAIGHDPEQFIAHCEAALAMDAASRAALARRMQAVVQRTSWEATADQMHALMARTPPGGRSAAAATPGHPASPAAANDAAGGRVHPADQGGAPPPAEAAPGGARVNPLPGAARAQAATVVLGAGPTGLSAAYHLGADSVLLERNDSVGGWCRSIVDQGFTFDHAGHIMFSNDPYVLKLYDLLLGDNQHWQMREAWVYSKNVYTRYPFQGALYGLPPEVIKECIVGAIEARYGQPPAPPADPACVQHEDCCADGGTPALAGGPARQATPGSFEDFIYRVWGRGIARHFAIPYNRKLWTVPLDEMETSWLGGRVPLPDLDDIIEGALKPVPKPMGPNARFGYPLRGGFQALMNGFLPHLRGQLELNARAVQVLPQEHVVALADGRRFQYAHLISTIPLPELIKLCGSAAPPAVSAAARALRHISIRCVNIGVDRPQVSDKHWIYYPEDTIFHRIFVQGNASKQCNAPGGFGFTCEISYSPWKPLPLDGEALIERCVADARRVGFLREDDRVLVANQIDMPVAYVVYDHQRARNVALVRDWLAQHDILLAGRYSEWEYYNSDHAFLAGQRAAQQVIQLRQAARPAAAKT